MIPEGFGNLVDHCQTWIAGVSRGGRGLCFYERVQQGAYFGSSITVVGRDAVELRKRLWICNIEMGQSCVYSWKLMAKNS